MKNRRTMDTIMIRMIVDVQDLASFSIFCAACSARVLYASTSIPIPTQPNQPGSG